jgi:enoyl-CoA hydratase/carnithine racemase
VTEGLEGRLPENRPLVRVEVADRVATVTLNRPEALNAISTELAVALAEAVEPLATDPGVRAMVLTGAGARAFCVGADLKQRAGFDDHGWFVQREAFRRGFAAVRRCPLPTVAAVAGFALGGGTELALACDLVVAADDAIFGLPEVRLGLVPAGGGTQLLVRRVGRSVAKDLVLTGRRVGAAEAQSLGLCDRVVPAGEALAAATALAAEIAANAPTAVRMAKWALDLAAAVEPLGVDPGVRAVVLTGAGERAFCVGADLKQRAGFDDQGWFVQREAFRRGFAAVRRCPLPTVAAVSGFALGGGTELAISCDLVVAADDATFGLPEVRLGLVPAGGGTQLLARRVGRSAARDLVLTGRRVAAAEALALGLADRVVARGEVLAAATALAAELAGNAPTAVRMAKWALEVGADLPLEAAMEVEDQAWRRAVESDDRREGIAAWVEKRDPRWPGG